MTQRLIEGSDWQCVENYVCSLATYVVACPRNRQCEVGMGIFALGVPRGEKVVFSGRIEITVIGLGSLYFRVHDNLGPCDIQFQEKSSKPISCNWEGY
jgi:hypothetical protein